MSQLNKPITASLATEIDRRIRALPDQRTESIRRIRREFSEQLRGASADEVLALAQTLVERQRWVAYELLYHHPSGLSVLDVEQVERLGRGIDNWGAVDSFGRYISGPAWQQRHIPDDAIHRWAQSGDRWWRRAALVSTVPLNLRSARGRGDAKRIPLGKLIMLSGPDWWGRFDLTDPVSRGAYQANAERAIAKAQASSSS